MKIGLFGGTYDPPHVGHVIVAEHAMKSLGLAEVRFIPAAKPPHKREITEASPEDRLAMIRLAIEGHVGLTVSDIEFRRQSLSYTSETLIQLNEQEPDHQFVLLIGMDNAVEFHQWHDPEEILRRADVVALTRPGFDRANVAPAFRSRIQYCEVPRIPVSSTVIRHRVARGLAIGGDVPPAVEAYIVAHSLYKAQ